MKQYEELFKKLNLTSEQVFKQTQHEGKVGSWVYCCDTQECWLSDEVYRLFHLKKTLDINSKAFLPLIHPDDLKEIIDTYKNAVEGKSYHITHRIIVDGKIKWVELNCKLNARHGIKSPYLIGSIHDITKLKVERDFLHSKRASYEAIDTYLSHTTNSNDLYSIAASAKRTIEKIIDVHFVSIFILEDDKLRRIVTKNSLPQCFLFQDEKDYIAYQAITSGKTIVRDIEEYSNKLSMEALLKIGIQSIVSIPIKSENKTIAAISLGLNHKNSLSKEDFKFCNTICGYLSAQLKNAMLHEQLKKELADRMRAESDIETIFSESVDFISIVDKEGNFTHVNPSTAKRLGLSKRALIGRSVLDFIHPEDRAYAQYIIDNIRTIDAVHGIYQRFICKNNEVAYLQINAKYAKESETIIGIARDVTDQKEVEAKNLELEKSVALEKLKGEFFANLSHEFKTPLNIIISSLDLLKLKISRDNQSLFDSDYKKFISYAYQNCYKLLRLTTNLLDSTKIDSQFLKANFSNCELIRLAKEITKSSAVYANARGISICFSSEVDETTCVCCDMDKVDRILLNLISNAIKNTPVGGKVKVHFSEENDHIVVTVKDTGVGISQEVIPYIFEKFQVTDKGLVGNHDGSGIGLSIVKSLVEMHDGSIWVDSQVGNGTCFTFTISKNLIPVEPTGAKLPDGMNYDLEARQSRVKMELSNIS